MSEDSRRASEDSVGTPDTYVPPALEVLGSVQALTQGSSPGDGDVPTGVISF